MARPLSVFTEEDINALREALAIHRQPGHHNQYLYNNIKGDPNFASLASFKDAQLRRLAKRIKIRDEREAERRIAREARIAAKQIAKQTSPVPPITPIAIVAASQGQSVGIASFIGNSLAV